MLNVSCHINRLCNHFPSRKTSPAAVSSAVEALTIVETSGVGGVGCALAPKYFNSVPERKRKKKTLHKKCIVVRAEVLHHY